MGDFRVLCSVRDGPQGVLSVNRAAEQALATARIIQPNAAHYAHKPILILRNDYALKLANGDLGILRKDEAGLLRAYFPGDDGTPRSFAPARLPEHEAAYAMTVHKAQGSEFGSILFIMPEADSPVLTRELVYTAITRARNRAEIWWSEETFSACIARRVIRWSGLRERLQD